jgi:hypothetical protein
MGYGNAGTRNQYARNTPTSVSPTARPTAHTALHDRTMNPQQGSLSQEKYVDPAPMPSEIPHVDEVGATSAPLKSAAFFIGAYCKEFNGSFRVIL